MISYEFDDFHKTVLLSAKVLLQMNTNQELNTKNYFNYNLKWTTNSHHNNFPMKNIKYFQLMKCIVHFPHNDNAHK